MARAAFRRGVRQAGGRLEVAPIPGLGADAEDLTIDWGVIGPAHSSKVLLSISGTHGAEGHAGSVAQRAFLASLAEEALPDSCSIVLVHALNPWGLSHGHRVDAENVDLSRNFCNFDRPRPTNPDYDLIHRQVCPDLWRDGMLERVQQLYRELSAELGHGRALTAFTGGQYTHADGLAFGGYRPSPSHIVLRRIVQTELSSCRQLAFLEWHTGAGAYGEPLIMALQPSDHPARARMAEWWAGLALQGPENAFESRETPDWSGLLFEGLQRWLPDTDITGAPIEIGTVTSFEAFEAVMIDRWLRLGTAGGERQTREGLMARLTAAYCPPDLNWQENVARHGETFHAAALRGLEAW